MNDFTYILKPYKGPASRNTCPSCGQRNQFSRYVNQAGNELADHVGRCNREEKCGYHYTPKQFFTDNPGAKNQIDSLSVKQPLKPSEICKPVEYLPFDLMSKSVINHNKCDLFPFLETLFRKPIASELCLDYLIGTTKDGYSVFWQVDITGKVRQAKVMQYDSKTGKRNKETGALFIGKKIINNLDANLQQCFFGEVLLSFPENLNKPIAIVESEKTAMIASVYFPQFVWIATGGKHGAKWTEQNVCKVLKGRNVILFPDLGAFETWKNKGLLMAATAGCKVVVSDILQKTVTDSEKKEGYDLADYLLAKEDSTGLALTDHDYPVMWDYRR